MSFDIDTILNSLGIDRERASRVRDMLDNAGQADPDQVLSSINDILGLSGVESLTGDYHVDNYYFNIVALYLNTGDSYSTTVVYETETDQYHLVSWGDWVEQNPKYRIL